MSEGGGRRDERREKRELNKLIEFYTFNLTYH